MSQRRQFCPPCRKFRDNQRHAGRTMEQRGYGAEHRRLRAEWAVLVEMGGVRCARCGGAIPPGAPWDLGHDDFNRAVYTGPEHRACNRATAGKRGRNTRRAPSNAWPW